MNIGSPASVQRSRSVPVRLAGEADCKRQQRKRIQLVLQIDQGNLGGAAPC